MTAVVAGRPLGLGGRGRLAWVVWRQNRAALIGLGVLAVLVAALMLAAGVLGHANYAAGMRHQCLGAASARCEAVWLNFPRLSSNYYPVGVTVVAWLLPVLAGVFLGAPALAREYERGTARFAWTQGTSRSRWARASLLALAVPVAAVSAALGALAYWSLRPFEELGFASRWKELFDATPLTLAAWALFAFLLGVTAGALLRRVVPAMATAGGVVTAFVLLNAWKLHGLLTEAGVVVTRTRLLNGHGFGQPVSNVAFIPGGSLARAPAGSWVLDSWFEGRNGHRLPDAALEANYDPHALYGLNPPQQQAWLTRNHASLWIRYQPAGHFWPLQGLESGVLVALALILAALTVLLVRRRPA